MIASAIEEANERDKLAQAEEENGSKQEGKNGEGKNGEEKKKEEKKSVDSETVEKTASALEYILGNIKHINWEKTASGIQLPPQKPNAPEPTVGAGIGETATPTNMGTPTPGMQNYDLGAANNQLSSGSPKDDAAKEDGQVNPQTSIQTDMKHVPGGTGEQAQLVENSKISTVRKFWNMRKQAEDAVNPAKVSAGSEPLENPNASASEENVPPSPPAKNAQESMISSNEAAINYTKGDAKAQPKKEMGQVLNEPAQTKSTDPVLQNNLDAASSAGVKISSVRIQAFRKYIQKLAQAEKDGTLTDEEKERLQKVKDAMGKNGKEKQSQGMLPSPTPQTPMMPGTTGF